MLVLGFKHTIDQMCLIQLMFFMLPLRCIGNNINHGCEVSEHFQPKYVYKKKTIKNLELAKKMKMTEAKVRRFACTAHCSKSTQHTVG